MAIVGRRTQVLEDAAQIIGGEIICCPCDVTDETAVRRMVKDVVAQFGRIDVLVHSAGVNPNRTDLLETSRRDPCRSGTVGPPARLVGRIRSNPTTHACSGDLPIQKIP